MLSKWLGVIWDKMVGMGDKFSRICDSPVACASGAFMCHHNPGLSCHLLQPGSPQLPPSGSSGFCALPFSSQSNLNTNPKPTRQKPQMPSFPWSKTSDDFSSHSAQIPPYSLLSVPFDFLAHFFLQASAVALLRMFLPEMTSWCFVCYIPCEIIILSKAKAQTSNLCPSEHLVRFTACKS